MFRIPHSFESKPYEMIKIPFAFKQKEHITWKLAATLLEGPVALRPYLSISLPFHSLFYLIES